MDECVDGVLRKSHKPFVTGACKEHKEMVKERADGPNHGMPKTPDQNYLNSTV